MTTNVLRANKFDFTKHPYAKKMIPASIFDYYPHSEPTSRPEPVPQAESQTEPKKPDEPQTEKKPPAEPKLFAAAKPPVAF